uniref:MI domain-containing protein n=1 Tax=Davidia involucrata TaxID=16924 RepID=A0A5B6ZK31_DAVIN
MTRKYRSETSGDDDDDDGHRRRYDNKKSSRSNSRRERRIEDDSNSSGSDEGEIRDGDDKRRNEHRERKESSGSSDEDDRRVEREQGRRDGERTDEGKIRDRDGKRRSEHRERKELSGSPDEDDRRVEREKDRGDRERTDRHENGHKRREKDDDYRGRDRYSDRGLEDENDRGGHKKSEQQRDRARGDERDRRRRSERDDNDENGHRRREAEESYRVKDRHNDERLERHRDRTGGDDDGDRKKRDRDVRHRREKEDNERGKESRNSREKEKVRDGKVKEDSKLEKPSALQEGNLNMDAAKLGRSGGIYIPPFKLARMMKEVEDKSSPEYQRLTWDALRKSINGLVNKVNATNIKNIIPELLAENLIRGRGLFCRSCMKSQMASPGFTDVFAALIAVVNTKFPEVGDLLLRRIVLQLKRAYKRNDKPQLLAAVKFIAHLVNQQVVHELVALELLTLLLDKPTDDSVEVAVGFVTECGSILQDLCPRGLHGIFERFRGILHEGEIDKRVQYLIEGLFAIRKAKFQGYPAVRPELDLVEQEDQLTHEISLQEEIDPEIALDIFKPDPQFLESEKRYEELKKTMLGEESEDEADSDASSDEEDDEDSDEEEEEQMKIKDETETNLINLRRTIYLTIMSSVDFEEAGHKLLKIKLEPGQEMELCIMLLECCSQERTYLRYYGLLGQRFCMINKVHQENFEKCFVQQYSMIHRLETNKLRNVAKFFAHLLGTDALPWHVLAYIRLTEEDTTSSSRIFIKILFQELSEHLGIRVLNERLTDPTMEDSFESIFPKDNPKNTRFSINFFTSIGLGGITEKLREYLKNMPRLIMQQQKPVSESDDEPESDDESGSSGSSTSDASSSESESDSSSSADRRRRKRRRH